ncbi:MAG: hypothetical protein HYZ51_04470 [Candidatus Doudnabacteria bacterium]|nr:hypothetical protein [Candidatus Doudnabacteria bacterium]
MDENKLEQLLINLKRQPLNEENLLDLPKEEKALILLAAQLKAIPVFNPPRAETRRKYTAVAETAPFWQNTIFSLRFAVGAAVFFLVLIGTGLGYSTANSLPGQKLFGLKKSAEQFRVKFASSNMKKAYLQVQIAKKRVAEAQKIIASDSRNLDSKTQIIALKELSEATEQAEMGVGTLSPQIIREGSEPLLASLEDIGTKERNLVSVLETKETTADGREDVIALSLKNQFKISEIKQSVEVATAEEAIASLSLSQDTVAISGQVTQIGDSKITVEKTTFILDEKTLITDQDSKKLQLSSLKPKSKVAVSGKKTEKALIALKITFLSGPETNQQTQEESKGEVKGAADNQEGALNSTAAETILNSPVLPNQPTTEPKQENPNSAAGTFIIEDPNPHVP